MLQLTNNTSLISKFDTFPLFSSLVMLFLMRSSNFIVWGIKSWGWFPFLILNVILFSILFMYIFIRGLSVNASRFLIIYSKYSWISDTEYEPSGNWNSSFQVGADTLILAFLWIVCIFPYMLYVRFDQAIYCHFFVSLFYLRDWLIVYEDGMFSWTFPEFINIASNIFYSFIEFIILLYTFFSNFFCSIQRIYD